jgi:hypothetical protein
VLKCRAGQSTDILPYNRAPALNCLVSFGCSTVLTDSSRIICRYRRPFPQIWALRRGWMEQAGTESVYCTSNHVYCWAKLRHLYSDTSQVLD